MVSSISSSDIPRDFREQLDALDKAPHRGRLWGFVCLTLSLLLERSAFFNGDNSIFGLGGAHGSLY